MIQDKPVDTLITRDRFNHRSLLSSVCLHERGARSPYVWFGVAGSTGRRNTGVKSLCWGVKLQGLTWPFVELASHFVQIGLRVRRQVGALRKILSQQAIGVLVRPALPRALRIAKIDVDFGRQRKATMIRKFLSPVPGQGLIQFLW